MLARIDNGRTQRFEWDHFNRLAAVRSNDVDTEFAYDPLGRRLLKHSSPRLPIAATAQAAANPAWLASETARLSRERGYGVTLYGWDGDQIAWEGDAETTTHYVFEPGSFVPLLLAKARQRIALIPTPDWSERDYDIDADPLWTYSPEPQPFEQLYFYHTDHLGTPQELTDAEGNLAWSADYKAWGEAKAVISDAAQRAGITNPLRFQGQYFDHETGLHYNRHRYYDPSVGRFISKDPISLQGGLNIFAYAPNPVEWIDPLGLSTSSDSKKLGTNLIARGEQRPGDCYSAHHLVMSNSKDPKMQELRTKMVEYGIDINSSRNGIWLPETVADRLSDDPRTAHKGEGVHSKAYKQHVYDTLNSSSNAQEFQAGLAKLKVELMAGQKFACAIHSKKVAKK